MYLESMLGKMAKDIPGLVERMEAAAASAASEDMVGVLLLWDFSYFYTGEWFLLDKVQPASVLRNRNWNRRNF